MPCEYYESAEERAQAAAKRKERRDRELNRVTCLLCNVLKVMDATLKEALYDEVPGLLKWVEEHEKRDAERQSK